MDKAPRMGYQLHPMKPPLWILVIAMISNLVAWAQEGSQVLVDDRSKLHSMTQRNTTNPRFTLEVQNLWVTNPTERRAFATTYVPSLRVIQIQTAAGAGDVSAQSRLAEYYLNGVPTLSKDLRLAYQWALIAKANGDWQSRHILRELDLFLTPAQIAEAKGAAEEFLKKQQESKR